MQDKQLPLELCCKQGWEPENRADPITVGENGELLLRLLEESMNPPC